MKNQSKTYVIQIPDCSGSYAAFDFEADEWRSTNDLTKTWQIDELTASDAADNFRETFGIDRTNHIFAILLSKAIHEEVVVASMNVTWEENAEGIVIKNCYSKIDGNLVIPAVIYGLPVVRIESWAFAGCTGLKGVTLPSSLTSIGDWAFYRCIGLTSVTIPSSVTEIVNYAFYRCSGLTSVTISSSLTEVGIDAFPSGAKIIRK